MFTKILVPLDGSEIAAKVLPKVVELAKAFKAKVTLLHVCYSGVGAMVGQATPGVMKAAEAHEQKFCDTFLAKAGNDLKNQGLDADWVCQDGVPAREIIAFAQDKGYDLIVHGDPRRRRSGLVHGRRGRQSRLSRHRPGAVVPDLGI